MPLGGEEKGLQEQKRLTDFFRSGEKTVLYLYVAF